jgi:hypothetical protein
VMHSFRQYVTCSAHTKLGPKRWKVSDYHKQTIHLTLSVPRVQPLYEALEDGRLGTYKRQVAVIQTVPAAARQVFAEGIIVGAVFSQHFFSSTTV